MLGDGCLAIAPPPARLPPALAHQPGHPMAAHRPALRPQFGMHPQAAIGLAARLMHSTDFSQQLSILASPAAFRAATPGVIAAGRDVKHLAHYRDGKLGL